MACGKKLFLCLTVWTFSVSVAPSRGKYCSYEILGRDDDCSCKHGYKRCKIFNEEGNGKVLLRMHTLSVCVRNTECNVIYSVTLFTKKLHRLSLNFVLS